MAKRLKVGDVVVLRSPKPSKKKPVVMKIVASVKWK